MYYASDSCTLTCYYSIIPPTNETLHTNPQFCEDVSHTEVQVISLPYHFTSQFHLLLSNSKVNARFWSWVTKPSSQVAYCWHQTTWAYSVEYHVSITLSWSPLLLFGFASTHQIPSSWTVSSVIFMCCMLYFMQKMTCYFDNCICYQNCNCDIVLRDDAMLVPCEASMGNVGNAAIVGYSNNWNSPSVQRSLPLGRLIGHFNHTVVTLGLLWYQRLIA